MTSRTTVKDKEGIRKQVDTLAGTNTTMRSRDLSVELVETESHEKVVATLLKTSDNGKP